MLRPAAKRPDMTGLTSASRRTRSPITIVSLALGPTCLKAAYDPKAKAGTIGTSRTVTCRSERGIPIRKTSPSMSWPVLPRACATACQSGPGSWARTGGTVWTVSRLAASATAELRTKLRRCRRVFMGVSLSLLGVDRPGSCGRLISVSLRHHILSHGPSPLAPRHRGQDPEYGLPVDVLEGEVDLVCSRVDGDGVGVRGLVLANRLQCGCPLVEDRDHPRLRGDVEPAPVRIEG